MAQDVASTLGLYRLVPAVTLFFTFYVLFFALTPSRYRKRGCRKWPGALFITAWWLATVEILPDRASLFGGYSRTYGSLAGVMIALIFFFVVGLGVVIGAELNAALAESGATALKGEVYTGPYTDELEVEEPQPGEDVEPVLQREGTATLTGLMQGKRGLIMGLANDRSLAWGIARALGEQGAELAFSYQGEALEKRVRPLAAELGSDLLVDCDVSDMKALDQTFDALKERWGDARLRRPRDRLFRQERAAREVRRHVDGQFPDDHEHLGLQLRRGGAARAGADEPRAARC